MSRRLGSTAVLFVLAASLAGPAGASGATEFGSGCEATSSSNPLTLVSVAQPATRPLPLSAPVSGVITRWKVDNGTVLEVALSAEILQVYRPTGVPNEFTLVGESAPVTLGQGANIASMRVPVRAGDRLGIHGVKETVYCKTSESEDVIGYFEGALPQGASVTFKTDTGFQVPGTAVIEPDADGDGFGDETQDACPQSAAHQGACPVTQISSSLTRIRNAVVVFVSSTLAVPVQVTGSVGLGGGRRVRLEAPVRTVSTRREAAFKLRFPGSLRSRLERLDPEGRLATKITVTAFNPFTAPSIDRLRPKLRGQAQTS